MSYVCDECGGDVHLALTGYFCGDCGKTWRHVAPENREGLLG